MALELAIRSVESRYTGKERDTESGLDNFGARYMSSSMGRFMSPDFNDIPDSVPYADFDNPQSLNLYSYVRNNPLSSVDPDGHDCVVGGWPRSDFHNSGCPMSRF